MAPPQIRFQFAENMPFDEIKVTLELSKLAVEGLFGLARVRLDATHRIDHENQSIVISERREPGRAFVRIFTSLLIREFGEQAFLVERLVPQACSAKRGRGVL